VREHKLAGGQMDSRRRRCGNMCFSAPPCSQSLCIPHQLTMQHPQQQPGPALEDVLRELWPSLSSDGIRALRSCCTPLRDAVDAHVSGLDGPGDAYAPMLSAAACARLCMVHTVTLRTLPCLRGMQLVAPPQPHPFPRLRSLRVLLEKVGRSAGVSQGQTCTRGGCATAMRMARPCSGPTTCHACAAPDPGGRMHGFHAHAWMPLGVRCAWGARLA
jgi:hypothetical protein